MRIVNTYEDIQYPETRFIISIHDVQSYTLDTFNLYESVSIAYFKFLLARNAFKLINKPNA